MTLALARGSNGAGSSSRAIARRLLAGLDVLAMPSEYESFGLSAAEAMLHGVPVLVSERTGIAEVIARHGGGRITRPDTTVGRGGDRRA